MLPGVMLPGGTHHTLGRTLKRGGPGKISGFVSSCRPHVR